MSNAKSYPFAGDFRITLPFGVKGEKWACGYHCGIDLVGIGNTDIFAVDNGTVSWVKSNGGYGNHLFIAHPDGSGTLYAHLRSVAVSAGQGVNRGQKIGVMGATGHVTGAHLHFECHTKSTWEYAVNTIDPATYLNLPVNQKGATVDASSNPSTGYTTAMSYGSTIDEKYIEVLTGDGKRYQVTGQGELGDFLYGRRYRVLVNVGKGRYLEASDLHCKFEIVKTSFMEPNTSSVTLYNLSSQTEGAIIQEGQDFIVEAGYAGSHYGLIFHGNVVQSIRYKENGNTYCLSLIGMDGDRFLTYGVIGLSLVSGQTRRDIVTACAGKCSVPTPLGEISDNLSTQKLPRGKVLFGMARDYLRQIAQTENASFDVLNGKIQLKKAADLPKGQMISISPESGLIGMPEQTEYGMSCKMLLDPRVDIGTMVAIDNSKIRAQKWSYGQVVRALDDDGIYRVIKVTHSGDTRGNDWYTAIETVSQAGMAALPGLMAGSDTYVQ